MTLTVVMHRMLCYNKHKPKTKLIELGIMQISNLSYTRSWWEKVLLTRTYYYRIRTISFFWQKKNTGSGLYKCSFLNKSNHNFQEMGPLNHSLTCGGMKEWICRGFNNNNQSSNYFLNDAYLFSPPSDLSIYQCFCLAACYTAIYFGLTTWPCCLKS